MMMKMMGFDPMGSMPVRDSQTLFQHKFNIQFHRVLISLKWTVI